MCYLCYNINHLVDRLKQWFRKKTPIEFDDVLVETGFGIYLGRELKWLVGLFNPYTNLSTSS